MPGWEKTSLKDSAYEKENEISINTSFAYFVSKACTYFEVLCTVPKILSKKQAVKSNKLKNKQSKQEIMILSSLHIKKKITL